MRWLPEAIRAELPDNGNLNEAEFLSIALPFRAFRDQSACEGGGSTRA